MWFDAIPCAIRPGRAGICEERSIPRCRIARQTLSLAAAQSDSQAKAFESIFAAPRKWMRENTAGELLVIVAVAVLCHSIGRAVEHSGRISELAAGQVAPELQAYIAVG